jgi:3-oxoacyl-[acyl-carrier protein] reductase
MGELDGKVALVTGAAQGIGLAAAMRLSAAGAHVVISDIDADAAQAAADSLPGSATIHAGDLTKPGAPDAAVQTAIEAFEKLDIIVNNAGYSLDAPVHKVTDEAFQAMLDIHTVVPFRILRAAAPYLREPAKAEQAAGEEVFRKVVNVSSLSGVMGNAGQAAYASGKAGMIGLTKAVAKEWGPLKINVNAVAFGAVETRLTAVAGTVEDTQIGENTVKFGVPEKARTMMAAATLLGRAAQPDEAAAGIYFLCSPLSNFVHGQVLPVSGGLQMGMTQ